MTGRVHTNEELCLQDRDPAEYRITMRLPQDCQPTECDLFIGIDTNAGDNEWLDVYMEGNAERWIAVGFSRTNDMVCRPTSPLLHTPLIAQPTYPPS